MNYVAALMEKIVLSESVYVFKPLSIIEGTYDEENNEFIDKYDNIHYDIRESHINLTENTEYFGFPIKLEQLAQFSSEKDNNIGLKAYLEDVTTCVYIGTVDEETEEMSIIDIPFENLAEIAGNYEETGLAIDTGNMDVKIYMQEEKIRNILKMEKIEDIKSFFNQCLDSVTSFKEQLLEEIKQENIEPEPEKKELMSLESKSEQTTLPFDINDMYNYITSKVINQDEAVKKIIMNFALNYLSALSNKLNNYQPTRCLITGPTGVGKTMILEAMIEYLENKAYIQIPMVKVPTSQLTVAGYVGLDLEDVLAELVNKVKGCSSPLEQAEYASKHGLVFFDEIDKKGSNNNGDVSGRGVLNSLLQFLDGSSYELAVNRTKFYFNTKHLNVFASGAFTNVSDEVNKTSIGFTEQKSSTVKKQLNMEDFIQKGQMPSEFMGRFHQIINLNPLGVKDLQSILINSVDSPMLVEQAKLGLIGTNIAWDDSFIEEVAKKAYKLNLGARSLKTIIEETLFDLKWNALTSKETSTILITKETVENSKQYKKL